VGFDFYQALYRAQYKRLKLLGKQAIQRENFFLSKPLHPNDLFIA
jgi:hypothetical protein